MPLIEAIVMIIYLLISFCSGEESSLAKLSSVESLASSSSLPDSCLAWLCVACDSVMREESGCVLAVRAL